MRWVRAKSSEAWKRHGVSKQQGDGIRTVRSPQLARSPSPFLDKRGGARGGEGMTRRLDGRRGDDEVSRRAIGDGLRGERLTGMWAGAEA